MLQQVFCLLFTLLILAPIASRADDTYSRKGAYSDSELFNLLPGAKSDFTKQDLALIKQKLEDQQSDNRYHIDRTEPRFKQLNAIGQVVVEGQYIGTGTLVYSDLVLTVNHLAEKVGQSVTFNVGQSNSSNKIWADTVSGTVIATGANGGHHPGFGKDWALIRIDRPLGNKYGFIEPWSGNKTEFLDAVSKGHGVIAGYPAFKDPRYLWGVVSPKYAATIPTVTSSPAISGAPYLWEYSPGKFRMLGIITGDAGNPNFVAGKDGAFSMADSTDVHFFEDEIFGTAFGPAYLGAIKQSPKLESLGLAEHP